MNKKFENEFYRCNLPLGKDELDTIDLFHRNRPFYLLGQDPVTKQIYALGCTTKKMDGKLTEYDGYEIDHKTTIKLTRIYWFKESDIEEKNYIWNFPPLRKFEIDDLMKKMLLNGNFRQYPPYVKTLIKDHVRNSEYNTRDIICNPNEGKLIIARKVKDKYECVDIFRKPKKGYIKFEAAGYLFYVDPNKKYYLDNLDDYVLFVHTENYENLKYKRPKFVKEEPDLTTLETLPIGSFIRIEENNQPYNLIKIGQIGNKIQFLKSEKDSFLRDYRYFELDKGEELDYAFLHMISESKINYIRTKIQN